MSRWIEVYTGAYASGKSETALNRALKKYEEGETVTIVDLDTVEPAYTLRPIKKRLESKGLTVIAHEDAFGLGEAGSYITPQHKMCLKREENLVIDVGYGSGGVDVLTLLEGIDEQENLYIYMVINPCKFETSSVENIKEYVKWATHGQKTVWPLAGLIANPHYGDHTTVEDILKGYQIVKQASEALNMPIRALDIDARLEESFQETGFDEVEVWPLTRMMPDALW